MWNMFFVGIVSVLAGACITWLVGDALTESVAARSEDAGRFAGLGSAAREAAPRRRERMDALAAQRRRAGALTRRRIAHHPQRSPLQ